MKLYFYALAKKNLPQQQQKMHTAEKVVQTRKILSALNTVAEIVLLLGGITTAHISFHPQLVLRREKLRMIL